MERRNIFTIEQMEKLKVSVRGYSRAATGAERKKYREKMRSLGFYVSEFGIENIDMGKFESLLKSGRIGVISNSLSKAAPKITTEFPKEQKIKNLLVSDLQENLCNGKFIPAKDLDKSIDLDCTGFYCIRLKEGSKLPGRYQKHLVQRNHRIIYIGKAEGQTLKKRLLGQELRARGHGTFFRSIGAVLGYCPKQGSLLTYKNKKNYKFCSEDEKKIISWIDANLEVNWVEYSGNFKIEKDIIVKFTPLLNDTHNPIKLKELKEDKAKCRTIANSQNN